MFKRLLCLFILLALLGLPLNVFASQEVSFSLTDVSSRENRLFETKLSVSCNVSAFVASLDFDQSKLEFKEAKATNQKAEISVNLSEAGKVKIAYLCENGAKGELVTFTFKSSEQSSYINLSAEQVIDSDSNDLFVTSLKGAEISVTDASPQDNSKNNNQNSTHQANTAQSELQNESSAKSSETYIEIPPKSGYNDAMIICIIGGTALVFAVAAVAFILGKKTSSENK